MRVVLLLSAAAVICCAQTYRIDTFAGTGEAGYTEAAKAPQARLNEPSALAIDALGRVYIADRGNNRVRRVDADGTIRTVAGNGEAASSGDGDRAVAAPVIAGSVGVDAAGNLYIGGGKSVRVVSATGVISSIGGEFESVNAIAVSREGSVLVADGGTLRRIDRGRPVDDVATGLDGTTPITDVVLAADGSIYFLAGSLYRIERGGAITAVPLSVPLEPRSRIAVDSFGYLYITSGSRIWKVAGQSVFPIAGTEASGFAGDGGPASAAQISGASGIALDPAGNVYFADTGNHRVRVLTAPAPIAPAALLPLNGATQVWVRPTLQWLRVAGATAYDVWLGTDAGNLTQVASTDQQFYATPQLEAGVRYFWRVVARQGSLVSSSSPVYSFTTVPAIRPPDIPLFPTPRQNAIGEPLSVLLTWQSSAAARYEVYAGDRQPMPLIAITEQPRLQIQGLRPETNYSWQVVAVNQVGAVASAVWQFATGPASEYGYVVETVGGSALPNGDNIAATSAVVELPRRPAVDNANNVYFIDAGRNVRRVDPDGRLTTVFTPVTGDVAALATDPSSNLYIATPEYVVRISRTGQRAFIAGQAGRRGFGGDGGRGEQALFDGISSIAADRRGNLYIADTNNHRIRVVTPAGIVQTFAGSGSCGEGDRIGSASGAPFCSPSEITTDYVNNLYLYEKGFVYRISPEGFVEVFAGTGESGYSGDGGPATEARIGVAGGMAADSQGNLYIADRDSMVIRRIDSGGGITTFAGDSESGDGRAWGLAPDGVPAARAKFAFPDGIAVTGSGELIVADWYNHRVRRIDEAGGLRTVAGSDTSPYLFHPTDVAVDRGGSIYVADTYNQRIGRITPGRGVETVAGAGLGGGRLSDAAITSERVGRGAREFAADLLTGASVELDLNGNLMFDDDRFGWLIPGNSASIFTITQNGTVASHLDTRVTRVGGIARGLTGAVYVSDPAGHRVLRIDEQGAISTVAGTGAPGYSGDGGLAILAQLQSPGALSVSPEGELFIAEFGRIRKVGRDGVISTAANEHANGLAHDSAGNLFVASNRFIYVLRPNGRLERIAGRDGGTLVDAPSQALASRIGEGRGIAVNEDGEIFFADAAENRVRKLTRNVPVGITIISGASQTVQAGQSIKEPLVVQVNGRTGAPVIGAPVTFTSQERGLVGGGTARTDERGRASATFGTPASQRAGVYVITATSPGLPPLEFRITVEPPPQ